MAADARWRRRVAAAAAALLPYAACHSWAADTVIVADGVRTTYPISDRFLDTVGFSVVVDDSHDTTVPVFEVLPDSGAIRFAAPPDSGVRFRVRYRTDYTGLPRTLRLYTPAVFDPAMGSDGPNAQLQSTENSGLREEASEGVRVSGSKSVAISAGNLGRTTLDQALEITLSGRLPRGTEIRGTIADRGSSLDGGTREIAELDRVYLSLVHPRFELAVGDQHVVWPNGGLITETRKIKGLSAGLTGPRLELRTFGSIAGGRYAVETLRGRDGLQGPYFLSGNGEPDIITPVAGTVRVVLDGRELREGAEADYTVDYDYGTITFAPSWPITADRTIRVEYEYKTFDYQRTLVGGSVRLSAGDSLLVVNGALWNELDNRHEPIDLELSPEDKALLAQTGDSSLERLVRVRVDARDVEEYAARYPLYTLRDSAGVLFFQHVRYDPSMPPELRESLYWVRFRSVPAGSGDYVQDTVDYRGPIYRYAGPGAGTATAGNPLPLPCRTTMGEIRAVLRPADWFAATADIAGLSRDRNLFSNRDDSDNNGAATATSVRFGADSSAAKGVWLAAHHRLITRDYTRDVLSVHELTNDWHARWAGRETPLRQAWEAQGGGLAGTRLSARLGYGQIRADNSLLCDRLRAAAESSPLPWLALSYRGQYHRHAADSLKRSRRQDIGIALRLSRGVSLRFEAWDEWWHSARKGEGDAAGRTAIALRDTILTQRIAYTLHGRSVDGLLLSMHDTSRTLLWEQSLRLAPSALWRMSAWSAYRRRTYETERTMTTLFVRARADYYKPSRGLGLNLDYELTSERAAALVQIPSYVGEGLGGFAYDTVRGELVPNARGAFAFSEREVLDNSTEAVVRKSRLEGTWSVRPPRSIPGIVGDLGWRGELHLVEHVLDDSTDNSLAWIPGVMTVGDRDRGAVPLANCFYEQRVSWEPDSGLSPYRGGLRVRPYVTQSRRGRERGIRGALDGGRSAGRWATDAEVTLLRYGHDGVRKFDVADIGAALTQKYRLIGGLRAVLTGQGGWARRLSAQGWYTVVRPGFSWEGADKGWAELVYSFAYVTIPGTLDYAMAAGFRGGMTHRLDCRASIALGEHFRLSAGYRGLFERPFAAPRFLPGTHALSAEVKAML